MTRDCLHIDLIAAARPNFMKVGPLYHALAREPWCTVRLVHTGQHYDANMSDSFFRDLELPAPDVHLGVGSGTHGEQTGRVMMAYEAVCLESPPDWTIVVGDVNSTMACALAATKLAIKVAHLEAGLRSFDRSMPEEVNRRVTDVVADVLWTPSADGDDNLIAEGVPVERITMVGNIMLDAFERVRERIATADMQNHLSLDLEAFALVTVHRPSNVDDPATLQRLVDELLAAARRLPLVFAVHPRTRARLDASGLLAALESAKAVHLIEPLGYIQFMNLVTQARLVITDSGGLQEETTYLGIPCLTLRPNTERPVTINSGTNRLLKPSELVSAIDAIVDVGRGEPQPPALWDGQTARRVVSDLRRRATAVSDAD